MKQSFLKSRAFLQGSIATVFTIIVVVALIVFNIVVGKATTKFNLRLDLTADDIFSLSEASKDYLANLNEDITIYILNSEQAFCLEGMYMVQAAEVINQYAVASPKIKVNYVDLMKNPGFLGQFASVAPAAQPNDILVTSNKSTILLSAEDLLNIQSDDAGLYVTSSKAEQTMTSSIVKVTSEETSKVAILSGHSASQASGLAKLLALNNYEVLEVNLDSQPIPADTSIVILSAPQVDYTEQQLKILDDFLINKGKYGKTLFYLASVDQPELPAITKFFEQWGIQIGDGVMIETERLMLSGTGPAMTNVQYAEDFYSKAVHRSGLPMTMQNSRPLTIIENAKAKTNILLQFSPTAYILPYDADENWQPTDDDSNKEIAALALSQNKTDGAKSTVIVASTSLAIEESILATPFYANSKYFLSLFGMLAERSDNIIIESKQIGTPMLAISDGQTIQWGGFFAIIVPVLLLVAGAIIFLRRRHL